jgi:hypothetical protein
VADFPAAEFHLDGEPSAIRRSAHQWSAFGTAATAAAGEIRSLDSSLFIGPEGDQYREVLNHDLPPHLHTTGQAYTNVGTALGSYADTLSRLQDRMAPLRVKAPALWEALQQAHGRVGTAQSADHQHQTQAVADARDRTTDQPAPPDPYHSDLGGATASLSAAQRAWDDCLTAARAVRADLRTAVDGTDRGIRDAAALRFTHNPHCFGALTAGFKDFVKDHAKGLAKLSGALKIVSGVAALLAFIPVVGEAALLVSALAAGTALAIDASIKFATGKGSWTSIAIDGALLAVPFGIGKGIQALRGARGAEKLAETGADAAGAVTRPAGVRAGWTSRTADNGKGTVFQRPGAMGNSDMVRVMDPTERYPDGYVRFYNEHGQPIGLDGKPGPNPATHIRIGPDGSYPLPPGW